MSNTEQLLQEAINRINDLMQGDDGQAYKEARKFLGKVKTQEPPAPAAVAVPAGMEPFGYWHQGPTDDESDFHLHADQGDVSCEKCTKLYTSAQVLAMGRVPMDAEATWDAFAEAMRVNVGVKELVNIMGSVKSLRTMFLASAPRPPVAQDELEIEQTRREAESLAWGLFNRHYAKGEDYTSGRSVFGLCDSLRGVLSQIDNMTAGLVREPASQALSRFFDEWEQILPQDAREALRAIVNKA